MELRDYENALEMSKNELKHLKDMSNELEKSNLSKEQKDKEQANIDKYIKNEEENIKNIQILIDAYNRRDEALQNIWKSNKEIQHLNNMIEEIKKSNLNEEQKNKEINVIKRYIENEENNIKSYNVIKDLNNEIINGVSRNINMNSVVDNANQTTIRTPNIMDDDNNGINNDVIDVDYVEVPEGLDKDPLLLKPNIDKIEDEYANDYNEKLSEYGKFYDAYRDDIEKFDKLGLEYQNGNLTDEEYGSIVSDINNIYKDIKNKYEEIYKLYEETKKAVLENKTWHPELTADEIEYLKKEGIKPGDSRYDEYLKSLNIKKDVFLIVPTNPKEPNIVKKENVSSNYKNAIFNYYEELKQYKKDLQVFDELGDRYINNELSEEEYISIVENIKNKFNKMDNKYNDIYKMYLEEKQKVSENKTWHPNLTDEEIKDFEDRGIKPSDPEYISYINEKGYTKDNVLAPEMPEKPVPKKKKENVEVDDDEDEIEVVKSTPWQWIKDHKKQILIALGITALAISLIVVVTQLLPAIMAAQQATYTSGILSQMVTNSNLWAGSSIAEQAALHGANTALASNVSALTGMTTSFNAGSGIWTIGSQALGEAAKAAAITAAKAKGAVTALQTLSLVSGIGGLSALGLGTGLINRSDEFKNINEEIKLLSEELEFISDEDYKTKLSIIHTKIEESKISFNEKKVLLKKLKKVSIKRKKLLEEPDVEENMEEETKGRGM